MNESSSTILQKQTDSPLVSVVIATFNRSNVLKYAVESVLQQTFSNWELIVVGDACTDDTGLVMDDFMERDSRIRYHNRETNWGEQSVPNNDGVAMSRGDYIAYLNHDDIWLEDHLEVLLDAMVDSGHDMAFSLTSFNRGEGDIRLLGATPKGLYDPTMFVPASSWLVTRALVNCVGPWKPANELYNVPSQDWCFRAWRIGKKLVAAPVISVAAVPSGSRRNSYSSRESNVHREVFEQSRNIEDFRIAQLTFAIVQYSAQWSERQPSLLLLEKSIKNAVKGAFLLVGIAHGSVVNFIRHPGKGGLIKHRRRIRGLD